MRADHGLQPRNPYNMIIQENHAATRANLIIPYWGFLWKRKPQRKKLV